MDGTMPEWRIRTCRYPRERSPLDTSGNAQLDTIYGITYIRQCNVIIAKHMCYQREQRLGLEHLQVRLDKIAAHEPALRSTIGATWRPISVRGAAITTCLVWLSFPLSMGQGF